MLQQVMARTGQQSVSVCEVVSGGEKNSVCDLLEMRTNWIGETRMESRNKVHVEKK